MLFLISLNYIKNIFKHVKKCIVCVSILYLLKVTQTELSVQR